MRCRLRSRPAVTVFHHRLTYALWHSTARPIHRFSRPVHTGWGKRVSARCWPHARYARNLVIPSPSRWTASRPPQAMKSIDHRDFTLSPEDNERLAKPVRPLRRAPAPDRAELGVEIANRGFVFRISGPNEAIVEAQKLVEALAAEAGETVLTATPSICAWRRPMSSRSPNAPRSAGGRDQVKRGTVRGRGAISPATCTRSPPTTSTSASARPVPARPSWPWPARSKH